MKQYNIKLDLDLDNKDYYYSLRKTRMATL